MDSLQNITYDSLLSKLPPDVIEKLQEKALERNLDKVLDVKKRRDICIMVNNAFGNVSVLHEFKNATKAELPFLMKDFPNDEIFDKTSISFFNQLVIEHKDELKENKMFKDVLVEDYKDEYECEDGFRPYLTCKVPPELITELYTNILSYKDLIKDINEIFEGFFTVCFKDEETWEIIDKLTYLM